ncbi:MAG: C_GCAxxG_C_C family protein [Thermoflexales bacterium]|nr:C_GCAxxG_C_C family protein [Thermoflexales bacterium]
MTTTRVERARECFAKGFNCAQAVISAYGPELGLEREMALRVAGAFGGGMGRMGHTCGAVSGAFMVIGLKYGKAHEDDDEAQTKEKAYALVREFTARFAARHGTITCNELLGCDISTPEGHRRASEMGLFTRCPQFVQDAVEILELIINN